MSLHMTDQEYQNYLASKKKHSGNQNKVPGKANHSPTRNKEAKAEKPKKAPKPKKKFEIQILDVEEFKPVLKVSESIKFVIPLLVNGELGLNKIYSGGHWLERNQEADKMHEYIALELKRQKIPKHIFKHKVQINLYYNTLLDIDNHGYISKLIVDSFKGYFIEEDKREYVDGLLQKFWNGDGVLVEIVEVT